MSPSRRSRTTITALPDVPRRARPGARPGALALALALAALVACVSPPDEVQSEVWPTPQHGMVVSEHPLATTIGKSVLEAGGNAADAAVATAFALAVVYPQAGNLGGGGFALWVPHDPLAPPMALDFRETAPADVTRELYLDSEGRSVPARSLTGPLAVAVPGSPIGLWTFHRELGRLPFAQVVAPAIVLARDGFSVDAWLARALRKPEFRAKLVAGGMARAVFYPGGEPLSEGDLLVQEVLADTLVRIATAGPDGFYRGDVAEAILGAIEPRGGVLSRADLAAYRARWREPLRGWFRGLEVITMPPPSSGGLVLLQVLSMLDGLPLDDELLRTRAERVYEEPAANADPAGLSGRALHWWIEAMRAAFADRARHMGDPDFWDVPVDELLSPRNIAARRTSIGELANAGVAPLGVPPREGSETTHVSVLDREGNAVSLTTTLNSTFGSGIMVRGGGFLLNNQIDDFAILGGVPNQFGLVGADANALAPRKRPLSSMTPAVLREGGQTVRTVLGSPGGPRIISSVIEVILRTEVYGQPLDEAVRAPRLHQQWNPAETLVERGFDPRLLQDLRNRNHALREVPERFGSVQAIRTEAGGTPVGVSDPRRGGAVGVEGGGVSRPARPPDDDVGFD